jgi:hypothetical protein
MLEQLVRGRVCELRVVDVAIELDQPHTGSVVSQSLQQRGPCLGVVERLPVVAETGGAWEPNVALSPVACSAANDRLTVGDFGSQPRENSLTRRHLSAFNVVSSLDSRNDKFTHGH